MGAEATDNSLWLSWLALADLNNETHTLCIKPFGKKYEASPKKPGNPSTQPSNRPLCLPEDVKWKKLAMLDPSKDAREGRLSAQATPLNPKFPGPHPNPLGPGYQVDAPDQIPFEARCGRKTVRRGATALPPSP